MSAAVASGTCASSVQPEARSYLTALKACRAASAWEDAEAVIEAMQNYGLQIGKCTYRQAIFTMVESNEFEAALRLLESFRRDHAAQGGLPEEWEITASRVFEDALAYYDAQGDLEAILLVNEKLRDCGLSRENLRFYG